MFLAKGKTFTFKEFPKAVVTARNLCFSVWGREVGIFQVTVTNGKKVYDAKAYIKARYASAFYDRALWQQFKDYEATRLP